MEKMMNTLVASIVLMAVAEGSPLVRTAPEVCPLKDGNILRVKLFARDDAMCREMCEQDPECNFYKFYPSLDGKPPQCFFFETCGRTVYEAPEGCVLSKENCLGIRPFTSSAEECQKMCQNHKECGFYKFVANEEEGSGEEKVPTGRQIPIGRLADADTPEFCYLLNSCSKRMIENVLCTIGANNFLDVKLFVPDLASCHQHCEDTEGCRYYYWYPIDYSPAPLYCYLFQQCAAKDDEPEVALVVGGRHPGHYFIDSDDFNDIVTRDDVCPVKISPAEANVKRAGASSIYVEDGVLLCGGRSGQTTFSDCLRYDLSTEMWTDHSLLLRPRDESAIAKIGSQVILMGGLYETSVEVWDSQDQSWKQGSELPFSVARGCAVNANDAVILTGGHDNSSTASISTVLVLSAETGGWERLQGMLEARRDHACLYMELERTTGVLVTGGLGPNDEVLDSAEFYDLQKKEWISVSPLKVPRTEHTMSLVYGIPTVIGGVNGDEFLSSIERFDKSSLGFNVPLQRDWRIINTVLTSPRYEHTAASIPVSKVKMNCSSDLNEI